MLINLKSILYNQNNRLGVRIKPVYCPDASGFAVRMNRYMQLGDMFFTIRLLAEIQLDESGGTYGAGRICGCKD